MMAMRNQSSQEMPNRSRDAAVRTKSSPNEDVDGPPMKDEVFNNTSRRVIRVFLAIATGFAVIAIAPLVVLWIQSFRGGASADTRQGCFLMVWITSPLMLAMLFSALLTIPTARKADREFDQFRGGDLLVRWEYSPDFWLPYVEAETHRLRGASKGGFGLIFGPLGVLALYIVYFVTRDSENKIEVIAIIVALLAGLMSIYIVSAKAVIRFRRNALLDCPRAYIGRSAIYCGGIFDFWGSQLRALQSVRLLPGHAPPGVLEFVIGLTDRAAVAFNTVSILAMRPGFLSSYSARQVIPIPPGEESRAAEIVTLLRSPEHMAPPVKATQPQVSSHPAMPIAVAQPAFVPLKKPPALSGVHHDPRSLREKAVRWFILTVILLIGGLGLFLLAIPIDSGRPAGAQPSSLATGIEVAGLFAWMLSPAALIMSIIQWFRSRHSSHTPIAMPRTSAQQNPR